jgi:hypothetical protein
MANRLKIQQIRTNDVIDDSGKQFELGKAWCDFFGFDPEIESCSVNLIFKAISVDHKDFNNKEIELKLAEVSNRGDRKAYANGDNGLSQIKDFFLNYLHLNESNIKRDYFGILQNGIDYYLYFIPQELYDNFIKFYTDTAPQISIERVSVLENSVEDNDALQVIYYGAPGTGKSHTIKEQTEGEDVIRTTFHPDSDYSTFVGSYKPTTREVPMRDVTGKVIVENDDPVTENRIIYEFVSQAFLQAYVGAWQKYAQATDGKPQKQYLVIEEINRGNCAQIFGDLFQLLDRNSQGFSEYPIKADADLKKHLKKLLKGLTIENAEAINALYKGEDVVGKVLNGEELLLPSNLYIWATMNTSDQSLFPIDSAFKRRWDWSYVPIANAHENWTIAVSGKQYDWWDFLEKINALIGDTTNSEDKKLGYFFCKTQDGSINSEAFVGKVIFYLWNDVFKDFDFDGDVFIDDDGTSKLTFDKFYKTDEARKTTVREDKVDLFLTNLGVKFADEVADEEIEEIILDENNANVNDRSSYLFNGDLIKTKAELGLAIMVKYIEDHREMTFDEIRNIFPDNLLGRIQYKGLIVRSDVNLGSYARYYSPIFTSQDGVNYRIFKQWTIQNIDNITGFAKLQGWTVETLNNEDGAEINDDKYKESISEIRFPDGSIITTENQTQFNAFIEALQKIGIDKVFSVADELKYQRLGRPILSREKYPEIESSDKFSYHQIGDYYIIKGAKPYTSVRILEDLSKLLDLNITVICNRPE